LEIKSNYWLTRGVNNIWRSKGRRDLLTTGFADVVILVISFITGILTARLLGPEGRGELAVVILWPSVIAAVGSLGIRDALIFEQAKGLHSKATLAGTAIILAACQSSVLMLLGWFLIPILTKGQTNQIISLTQKYLFFIFLNLTSLYLIALLQGRLHITLYNITRISVNLFYLLGIVILAFSNLVTVENVAFTLLVSNVITVILALTFTVRNSGLNFHFQLAIVKGLFIYGLKSHVGGISHMFNERLDQMVLALLLSPKELGWYVVAVSVANMTKVAASPFAQMIFPRVTGQEQSHQKLIIRVYSRYALLSTGILAFFLYFTLPYLLPFVYGNEYRPSIVTAEVLVVASVFLGIGLVWRQALAGLGEPLIASQAEVLSLIVTAAGIYFLVPTYGILGAAWVSLVAYSLAVFYLGWKLKTAIAVSWKYLLGL